MDVSQQGSVMDNSISIAMTPAQMAAVMTDETISESSFSNRAWGGIEFLGGILELASATALCLVPEPTGLTKAGCIIVGTHGMDTVSSAAYQVYTGKQTASITARATAGIAREMGLDDQTAEQIGIAVDVIIPFSIAGAVRVASVRMGQINLMEHEAVKGIAGGGHTIKKHVGKSESELIDKIKRGLQSGTFKASGAASSFTSLKIAEKAISKAMKANAWKIRRWARSTPADHSRSFLEFDYAYPSSIGIVVKASTLKATKTNLFTVVLQKKSYNGKPLYVLTAYPRIR